MQGLPARNYERRRPHGRDRIMTIPQKQPPTLWPPNTVRTILSDDEQDERLARAFKAEENWVNDFVKRLNGTIKDIVQKK
jgi:hypothetical protein